MKPIIIKKCYSADFDTLGGDDCVIVISHGDSRDGYGFKRLSPKEADKILAKLRQEHPNWFPK